MAESKTFGYARVSTAYQNADRQIKELLDAGVPERNIFIDKESGRDFNRDQYQLLFQLLREGDVVFIPSIDRLGRNYTEISRQWAAITQDKKADIVILDMAELLDTRKRDKTLTEQFISDIVVKLLSYIAEIERRDIRERQRQGIELAKARGVYRGRKPVEIDKEKFEKVYGEVMRGERTNKYAMKVLGLKNNTYYKAVKEFKTRTGRWA